jgi:hypothetical protein
MILTLNNFGTILAMFFLKYIFLLKTKLLEKQAQKNIYKKSYYKFVNLKQLATFEVLIQLNLKIMNRKTIFLSVCVMMFSATIFAQGPDAKNRPKSIISTTASVKNFFDQTALQAMNKRALLDLYVERLRVITYTIPNIALTVKPGVTLEDLGVPMEEKNTMALQKYQDATSAYIANGEAFINLMMPYADKTEIIQGILFYDNIIKSIKTAKD